MTEILIATRMQGMRFKNGHPGALFRHFISFSFFNLAKGKGSPSAQVPVFKGPSHEIK